MFICNNPTDALALAKRILWLAYNASVLVGMGFLQERSGVTEAMVWDAYASRGNFAPRGVHEAYVDYGFGRMMKVGVLVGREGCNPLAVEIINSGNPRRDYQSFAVRYPTYGALMAAAVSELGLKTADTVPA